MYKMKPTLLFQKIPTQVPPRKSTLYMDSQVSQEIPILRGVRQGNPTSPKLFTATIQEVFKNAQLEEKGINIDGEKLLNLRFADDVAPYQQKM